MIITGLLVRRELLPAQTMPVWRPKFDVQPDWASYAQSGRRVGPESAKVVLVEFGDFECPACRTLEERLGHIRKSLPGQFAIVFRHAPLPIHQFARDAAIASECAARQGRFEQLYLNFFHNQDSLGVASWRNFAERSGVSDLAEFDHCLKDPSVTALLDADMATAKKLGVNGTPTILIDGKRFTGTIPEAALDSIIRLTLAQKP